MPIVSSVILKQRNRGNGTLHVMERYIDHLGINHEHRYYCPENHDTEQALLDWIQTLEASLISNEKQEIQSFVESGGDPSDIVKKYINNTQLAKAIIKALMWGEPVNLLKAAQYVDSFSDNQIENFFTISQRIRIRARESYILDNQTIINSDIREEL